MKKEQIANSKSSKKSVVQPIKTQTSPKKNASVALKVANAVNYSKVISYMVRSEENETHLMIASASTLISH